MKRKERIEQLLNEARQRVNECDLAVKGCEDALLQHPDSIEISKLLDDYRQCAIEQRDEVAMWEELLSKNSLTF